MPITNPSDVQLEAEAVRTAKLRLAHIQYNHDIRDALITHALLLIVRSAYDKCRQMVRQKIFKLEEMVISTEEKSSNDEQVAALFESAEIAKASLDERLACMFVVIE